jgi:hypothetical protein
MSFDRYRNQNGDVSLKYGNILMPYVPSVLWPCLREGMRGQ